MTDRQAIELAISTLNQIVNTPIHSNQYGHRNTYEVVAALSRHLKGG